tara:strand:- start:5706 stop:6035 length:330 start_codon:yes stop_codon:yes gene_type:complete
MPNEMKTIDVVRVEMDSYIKEGRTSAFGGGTKLPMDTSDADATLTGNYQNILYSKQGEDKVLTLAEFKCGKITDTTAVNHTDTRLVKGSKVQVSVKEISGQFRNTIVFV